MFITTEIAGSSLSGILLYYSNPSRTRFTRNTWPLSAVPRDDIRLLRTPNCHLEAMLVYYTRCPECLLQTSRSWKWRGTRYWLICTGYLLDIVVFIETSRFGCFPQLPFRSGKAVVRLSQRSTLWKTPISLRFLADISVGRGQEGRW